MRIKKEIIMIAVFLLGIIAGAAIVKLSDHKNRMVPDTYDDHAHKENEGHEEHAEEIVVNLSDAEMEEFGIEVATAGPEKLQIHVTLPGEIVANPDLLSHIVPYVPGVAREVRKKLGDRVRAGEVMAVLDSRELSEMKSVFLVAKERLTLAETTFRREESLWKQSISSERVYLEAKKAYVEARIELEAAEQKLHSIGLTEKYLKQLTFHPNEPLTRYEIIAPFDGIVIEKHITMGEAIKDDFEAFVIADLRSVWVNLTVYQKDLDSVHAGKQAVIRADKTGFEAISAIDYVSPIMDKSTRTATARIVLTNEEGYWLPGMFVTGQVKVKDVEASLVVPRTAILTLNGQDVVFVQKQEGFEPQPVIIGQADQTHVEIVSGLEDGQRYVAANAFSLKAELSKSSFGGHQH